MENHQTEVTENEELCDLYRKKAEELVSQMTIEELADDKAGRRRNPGGSGTGL